MKKTKIVSVKMTESDYEKLKIVSGDKGISECVRILVNQAYHGIKEDVKVFQNFERMTETMSQLIERLSSHQLIDKEGLELRHFKAIMEVLKTLGTLMIALPDKRRIFETEIKRIESSLQGDEA